MSYLDLEVKIHSALADDAKPGIKLWYILRGVDMRGSGWAQISINGAAEALRVTRRTIKNYLRDSAYLFRAVIKIDKDTYKVFYNSQLNVAKALGATTYGAMAFATTQELRKIKVSATEITAQSAQAASHYKAKLEQSNFAKSLGHKPRVPLKPEDLFSGTGLDSYVEPSSLLCSGALGFNDCYKTLFVNQGFIHFGASQRLTAARLNRHPSTIQRRLKHTPKVRLAKFDQNNVIEQAILYEDYSPEVTRFLKVNSTLICNNPEALGKTFKLLTNIYYPSYVTTSFKQGRNKLKLSVRKAAPASSKGGA